MPACLGAILCAAVVTLTVTNACADSGPFPGRAETEAFLACEYREALKQDDGKADIYAVAAKVAAICKPTYMKMTAVQRRYGYPPLKMNNFEYALDEVHGNRVIKFRAAHSNQIAPQSKLRH
jgi:hypothetical protein